MNDIKALRVFFNVSCKAFDVANIVKSAYNENITPSRMEMLHRIALIEVEKDKPNMELIDNLLKEMEEVAKENNT